MDISNAPSEAPSPGPWNRRRRLTLGLTALALVAGGGVAIAAGQPDTDVTDDPTATATAKPVDGKAAFGFGGVLHSESVVSDGNGGYVTHLTQVGKIESIDANNLTVVSEDGYKRSWARTSDTVVGGGGWSVTKNDDGSFTVKKDTGELATGDQVIVVGTLSGDKATALKIGSRPDGGEIPGMIMKRFEGEFGGKTDGSLELKQRMLQRFEDGGEMKMPGPMGGPGGEIRKFEFRTGPEGEAGTQVKPAPGEAYGFSETVPAPDARKAAPQAPSADAVPAEPSSATSSGYVKTT
jgi:hypothetical protein